ncbi:hypothetical protein ACQR3P_27230 [Rhodococcus sp. IEGM1300]
MASSAERLQHILTEPLAYLHTERLPLPADFEGPDARSVLNGMLIDGLLLSAPTALAPLSVVTDLWVRQWRNLPYIASLMGAWRLFPQLACGGALQQLPCSLRSFASYTLSARSSLAIEQSMLSRQHIDAAGFNALRSWSEQVSPELLERLSLQFSPRVIALNWQWPVTEPDPALFFLAVQHARLHPNPD